MQTKKNILVVLVLLISSAKLIAQNLNSVMQKVNDVYVNNNYHIKMDYTLYSNRDSNIKKDELKGEVIKSGDNYYTKMKETEMIFTNAFLLKISHSEKIILYSKLETSIQDLIHQNNPFMTFLEQFDDNTIEDNGNYYRCSFNKAKDLKNPYGKIVLNISKSDYSILKQTYFFKNSVEKQFNKDAIGTENERLEVVQKLFTKDVKKPTNLFSLDKYLTKIGENTYSTSNYIKDYQILTQ